MSLFRRQPKSAATSVTVYSGSEWLEVKGEATYQERLEWIAGPKTREGYNLPVDTALIREPDNEYDEFAIAVYATNPRTMQAAKVGYVVADMAEELAPAIDRKNAAGEVVGLVGHIRGGWLREDSEGHYGIWLLYDRADFDLAAK